jgi:hypothetical protein
MTVIGKTVTKLDYRRSMECASSVAKLVTRQITAIRKMPMVHKNLQCHGCGKTGHIAKNCWEKESYAHK